MSTFHGCSVFHVLITIKYSDSDYDYLGALKKHRNGENENAQNPGGQQGGILHSSECQSFYLLLTNANSIQWYS